MKMTDLLPKEEWAMLEAEIFERFQLRACAYDDKGFSFTGYVAWGNKLCPSLRETEQGIGAICSVAHQNIAADAAKNKKSVVEECDAGLVKICTPIFIDDHFVGVIGGCGRLMEDSEIDPFLIQITTGMETAQVEKHAASVPAISRQQANEMVAFLEKRVAAIVDAYQNAK